eukprot:TRINITY_DN2929_c0_g1_i3.p1 TRINITY_DN2929_c0_g1~~TRINITY_DN2929_c0_g1_i3.p1  ORF type:complete len:473 (-),score=97.05 TRINITY_DN2929_c0_g1_i3:118-1449(-)
MLLSSLWRKLVFAFVAFVSVLWVPFQRDDVEGIPKVKLYVGYVLAVIGRLRHASSKTHGLEQRQLQAPPTTEDYNDSWYFQAAKRDSNDKQIDVVMRLGFREKKKYVETWFYMRHPEFGDDVLTHPQTRYQLQEERSSQGDRVKVLRGGPLTFECVQPFKTWRIRFEGELVRHKPYIDYLSALQNTEGATKNSSNSNNNVLERFQAHAEFLYAIDTEDPFNFDSQLDDWATARTLAREPWSLTFFSELNKRHQTHYEQNGVLSGTLKLTPKLNNNDNDSNNNKKVELINLEGLRGMRDHSFGSREWGYIHRWVALFGCLEDGSSFNLVLVRMPTLTRVVAGYYREGHRSGNTAAIPVVDARPELHQLGEKDNAVPARYSFEFKLQDGRWLSATCDTEHLHLFVLGDVTSNHAITRSLLYEGLARYTINGVNGTGISEFTYAIP